MSGAPAEQTRSQTGVSVNKSYITQLENELNQERAAREKLQSDIEQIKQMNSEIGEKLGLNLDGAGKDESGE